MSKRATHLPTSSPEGEAPDVDRLIDKLVRHGVEFLLIGGVATQTYGAIRPTTDFDCLASTAGRQESRTTATRDAGIERPARTSRHSSPRSRCRSRRCAPAIGTRTVRRWIRQKRLICRRSKVSRGLGCPIVQSRNDLDRNMIKRVYAHDHFGLILSSDEPRLISMATRLAEGFSTGQNTPRGKL